MPWMYQDDAQGEQCFLCEIFLCFQQVQNHLPPCISCSQLCSPGFAGPWARFLLYPLDCSSHPLVLVPGVSWVPVLGTGEWTPSPALFFGMPQGRGSGGAAGGHCCALAVLEALGSHRAPRCCLSPVLLWPILSLNHFLPPVPFFQQCFCCCLLSQQLFYSTGCFDCSVNYLSRWSSSGVMLLACFFHIQIPRQSGGDKSQPSL